MARENLLKEKQKQYYRNKKGNYGKDYNSTKTVEFFTNFSVEKVMSLIPFTYKGKRILVVAGGGEGHEVANLIRRGGDVTVTDLSMEALKEVKKRFNKCRIIVADAEKLQFKDNSYDIGIVKNGLHHLPHPEKGISELLRVCKEGVLIIDFQETVVTTFLKKVGISPEHEDAGNPNFHFYRKDIERLTKKNSKKTVIYTYFGHIPFFEHPVFNNETVLQLTKQVHTVFNGFFSRWGNILLVAIKK